MKKENIVKVLLVLALAVFLISPVSANIIGGKIFAEGKVVPSWYTVSVFEKDNPKIFVNTVVSPDGYKYSFSNAGESGSYIFETGKTIIAEIVDFSAGFMTDPIEVVTTGKDYDIFNSMELREVIQVNQPNKKLFISNEDKFVFEANVLDNCNFSIFEKEQKKLLCEEGCDYLGEFNSSYGKNEFEFSASCNTDEKYKYFSNEQFREYADGSYKTLTLSDNKMIINFYGNKTWGGENVHDFVPTDFIVSSISNEGLIDESRGGYNVLKWLENSDYYDFSYEILPKDSLDRCEFGLANKVNDNKVSLSGNFSNGVYDLAKNLFYMDCNFTKKVEIQRIESVDFSDTLPSKLQKGKLRKVTLHLETSQNIAELELTEYVPIEFDVLDISNNGRIESSSSDYNVIIWDLNGTDFDFSYSIKSSVNGNYNFKTEVEGNDLSERTINIYSVVSSGGSGKSKNYKYIPEVVSKVSPEMPLIDKENGFTVALYSKEFSERGSMELFGFEPITSIYSRGVQLLGSYLVETNLGDNAGEFSFEYKIPKDEYSDVKFYGVGKKGGLFRMTGRVVSETDSELVYGSYNNEFFSKVLVYGDKFSRSIFDKWVDWQVARLTYFDSFWPL